MIIHQPELYEENGEVCVSARIEIKTPTVHAPDSLWFRVPPRYRDYVTDRSDAFIVAMLPVAMRLGEDMEIKGRVSPRLAFGVREYQQVISQWWPGPLKPINIEYDKLEKETRATPKSAVGCAFSGGIDSFYSLWQHLPANEDIPDHRITHCLMIDNFDSDINHDDFHRLLRIYEPMMHNLEIDLIPFRTNLRQVRVAAIEDTHRPKSFGAVITANALILDGLFSHFYIPSSHKYSKAMPLEGAHPMIDHLLSTEGMETIHDGASASRTEKTIQLTQWADTYPNLRVCFGKLALNEKTGIVENCCRCEKCVRTMIALYLLGALPEYTSFPQPLKRRDVRRIYYSNEPGHALAEENLDLARKMGRKDIVFDMRYAIFKSQILRTTVQPFYYHLPNGIQRILKKLLSVSG